MKHIHNRTKYFIDGVPAIDVARQTGISKNCLYVRVRKGWDLKRACTTKKISLKEMSNILGMKTTRIHSLLQKGYTKEDFEKMIKEKEQNKNS